MASRFAGPPRPRPIQHRPIAVATLQLRGTAGARGGPRLGDGVDPSHPLPTAEWVGARSVKRRRQRKPQFETKRRRWVMWVWGVLSGPAPLRCCRLRRVRTGRGVWHVDGSGARRCARARRLKASPAARPAAARGHVGALRREAQATSAPIMGRATIVHVVVLRKFEQKQQPWKWYVKVPASPRKLPMPKIQRELAPHARRRRLSGGEGGGWVGGGLPIGAPPRSRAWAERRL